jgi:cell division septal protein FtsQ
MFFKNKNKIKKRKLKAVNSQALAVSRQIRKRGSGSRIFLKILNVFLLLIFLGVVAYLLFLSPFMVISKINVSGTENLDPAVVRDAIGAEISGKYLNLIPKNNIILAGGGRMENFLASKFKRIGRVEVKKSFPDTLNIMVSERKSSLVLCSADKCFVVNPEGIAYAEADFGTNDLGENNLAVLYDDGNKSIQLKDNILDVGYVQYILDIKNKLQSDLGIEIDKNLHTPQLISGDIRVTTNAGWQIYFDESIPAQKQIDMLGLVLNQKIDKNKIGDLKYIDLRIDNKVYYKFKNSDQPQTDNSEGNTENNEDEKDSKKSKNT